MKLLLATDGSAYSQAAVKEVANRPFPPKTEVCIITVIDNVAFARNAGAWGAIMGQYEKKRIT